MVLALAPRLSRWWLAGLFLAAVPSISLAQDGPGKGAVKKEEPVKDEAKPADKDKDDDDKAGVIDKEKMDKQETTEVFEDPRAKALLNPKAFKEFPDTKPKLTQTDFSAVRNMAANVVGVNRDLLARFIDQMVADLSKQDYIKAVVEPDPKMPAGAPAVRGIEAASQRLIDLVNISQDKKNAGFLAQFEPLLFTKLTPLLEGHLLSRIQAAIILASAATPGQVDLFIKQIADPKQVVWVKHWSAVGLTNATNKGQVLLDVGKATSAAATLLGFLDKEPGTPWPVKLRVLQALGSLRLSSTTAPASKPDVAAYAFAVLSDPAAKPDLRGWAAWSLGMITVPGGQPYNYKLVAYQIGRLAADIGDRMVADYDQRAAKFTKAGQSDYARHLTGLLLYQVYPAVAGEDAVPNSGLLHAMHPASTAARPFTTGLEDQIKKLGRATNELLTAGGGQVKQARDDLAAQVVELKSFLDKNRPAPNETELFSGGPKIQLKSAPVAAGAARR
jgi:hypothetical protein